VVNPGLLGLQVPVAKLGLVVREVKSAPEGRPVLQARRATRASLAPQANAVRPVRRGFRARPALVVLTALPVLQG